MLFVKTHSQQLSRLPYLLCLSLLTGCSSGGSAASLPTTVPVTGIITLNGQPLSSASIIFIPRNETKGLECSGLTDAEGKFSLKHPRGAKGAPSGDYAVCISRLTDQKGNPIDLSPNVSPADLGATESLPPRYSSMTETQLTAVVPPAGGELNFDLKTKGR